jgi:hypothetical protein
MGVDWKEPIPSSLELDSAQAAFSEEIRDASILVAF